MKSEMLINVSQPEECRIAIIEDGLLEELYIERASADNYVGNIYKGRIVNLEPSIQAAFVDFGVGRNGFLHISDVEPQYFRQGGFDPGESMGFGRMADIDVGDDEPAEDGGEEDERPAGRDEGRGQRGGHEARQPRPRRPRSRRQIAAVADSTRPRAAAGRGSSRRFRRSFAAATKCSSRSSRKASAPRGRRSSTYISIPGRYLVLMPALGRVGVSRKIEDDQQRRVAPRHHAGAESAQGARASSSAPPARTARRRSCRAIWRICCGCGR